jgi:hypothetical protein
VRYHKQREMIDSQREKLHTTTLVRRLKSGVNELDESKNKKPRFCQRKLKSENLFFGNKEKTLLQAFRGLKKKIKELTRFQAPEEKLVTHFAMEVFNKRLLSSSYTFFDSWVRFREGLLEENTVSLEEVRKSQLDYEDERDNDLEIEEVTSTVSNIIGSWFQKYSANAKSEIEAVQAALDNLGLKQKGDVPKEDALFEKLLSILENDLRQGKEWKPKERLIVFTEYKTTLDYLNRRLQEVFPHSDSIQVLYGGMKSKDREQIILPFNDPKSSVKILIGTDAASEGLNLQETSYRLLHYDIPWNPSRLEQRNGRLDRHGQSRDVIIYHFTSQEEADLLFLGRVIEKVNQIREDLGLVGKVFDDAFEKAFQEENDFKDAQASIESIELEISDYKKVNGLDILNHYSEANDYDFVLKWFEKKADLHASSIQETFVEFLKLHSMGSHETLVPFENVYRIQKHLLNQDLRRALEKFLGDENKSLPAIAFTPNVFIKIEEGREVFRPRKDTEILHLSHPLLKKVTGFFSKFRFSDSSGLFHRRWTVSLSPAPKSNPSAKATIFLSVEEMQRIQRPQYMS